MKNWLLLAAIFATSCAHHWAHMPLIQDVDVGGISTIHDYYVEFLHKHPTAATEVGVHGNDAELEDVSSAAIANEVVRLKGWTTQLEALAKQDGYSSGMRIDLAFLRSTIAAQLLELEGIRAWQHRPGRYSGLASQTIYVIIKRDFAPLEARMKSVISREQKIPAMLLAGRANLVDVPKVSLAIALEELPGVIDFFAHDVPLAIAPVKDAALQAQFATANVAVQAALRDYGDFLRKEIAPKARAEFAIGEENFRKKLAAEEMVDTPIDVLLVRGEAELKRLQAEYIATAKRIDPTHSAREVQAQLAKDHPSADQVIPTTQDGLMALRTFIREKHLLTIPSDIMPRVQETPAFMRATTLASMETPGPFETKATEAFYNVTLPDPKWSKKQAEDYLGGNFNRPMIENVSVHEVFPGHYVQFLWVPKIHSQVRKYESANTNVEGWAHYCEQMMLDEGWHAHDDKVRLSQLQDALLRAARYVAGIKMHTRGMSFTDAVAFFRKEGYQSEKSAEMEAKRGTEDPLYLYYTLGKLEIYKLRDDYQKKLGAAYSLEKFHDAFLAEGPIPLPLMRRALGL